MNDSQIREVLKTQYPHFAVDANVSLLHGATTNDELQATIARMEGTLVISSSYQTAYTEHLSLNVDADDNLATRKIVFEKKKADDEAAEIVTLRKELKGVRLRDGFKLETLTLAQLRATSEAIRNQQRQKHMTASELRTEERVKNPVRAPRPDGMPHLPASMVLPAGLRYNDKVSDGIRAWEMTPDLIYTFARSSSSSAEFHFYKYRLVRAYGAAQVTERQQGI